MQRWSDVEAFLLQEAAADLRDGGEISPCLAAFRGEEPLFLAFLRSFARGAYADPIIELLALAAPLEADRLALSMGGRAWSMKDPIPPVVDGWGDLRQRVLCTIAVDGGGPTTEVTTTVRPFTCEPGNVVWAESMTSNGGEGWITGALRLVVQRRAALSASEADIVRQARRCTQLGHLMAFGEGLSKALGLDERPPVH